MNFNEAIKLTRELSKELFGMEFNIPIKYNRRLTRALGRVKFRVRGSKITPVEMSLAARLFENGYSDDAIIGVIKHEICHWALCLQGKPFNDGHPVFEKELKRIGAPSTFTIQFVGTLYQGICKRCNNVVTTRNTMGKLKRVMDTRISRCCREKIVFGGTREVGNRNNTNQEVRTPQFQQVAAIQVQEVNHLDVLEIIQPGKRGVTNAQMIPVMKELIANDEVDKLRILKREYPEVFQRSIKYIWQSYQDKLKVMLG